MCGCFRNAFIETLQTSRCCAKGLRLCQKVRVYEVASIKLSTGSEHGSELLAVPRCEALLVDMFIVAGLLTLWKSRMAARHVDVDPVLPVMICFKLVGRLDQQLLQ